MRRRFHLKKVGKRTALYVYLFLIIIAALYIIIFQWIPNPDTISEVRKTVSANGGNRTTETVSSTNTTTEVVTTTTSLSFPNGTRKLISEQEDINPIDNIQNILKARFEQPEVSLVALSSLFGLLGACIAAATSLYKQKLWNSDSSSKSDLKKRRTYQYLIRPWLGSSVAIITYLALRAGLVNFGMLEGQETGFQPINQFGVAAISATVGLMTDQIIARLKDIFRTFMGISTAEVAEEEAAVRLITPDTIPVAGGNPVEVIARLSDDTSFQDLRAEFYIVDQNKAQITGANPVNFNSGGVASTAVTPMAAGNLVIAVNVVRQQDGSLLTESRKTVTLQ
jgi:hypothetical protein